jgi:DNA primase
MLEQLSQHSGLGVAQLRKRVFGPEVTPPPRPTAAADRPARRGMGRTSLRTAIRLLLEQPALGRTLDAPAGFEDLDLQGVEILTELLELTRDSPNLTVGGIIEHWRGRPEEHHLARLATTSVDIPTEGYELEFRGAVQRLIEQRDSQKVEDLLAKERLSGLSESEKTEVNQLLAKMCLNSGRPS